MNALEFKKIISEEAYIDRGSPEHAFMDEISREARRITAEINDGYHTDDEVRKLFSRLIGNEVDNGFTMFPPIYIDYGKNITLGKNVFINSACCIQDQGGVEIGDCTFIGHQVVIATLNHDLSPESRGNLQPAPVRIGANVWIGAHATILPGVTIGDGAVVAAGAVVTRDIPSLTVVAGVPAKIVKRIGTSPNGD